MNRTRTILLALVALALAFPAWATSRADGFLYGTVETNSGNNYTGLIRWGTEEAFWDDLFNSAKDDLPYLEDHGELPEQTGP